MHQGDAIAVATWSITAAPSLLRLPDRAQVRPPTHTSGTGSVARLLIAAAVVGLLYGSTAALPHFSETYAHLARASDYSVWQAFDPLRVPFRPLQHLYFAALRALGSPEPWVARILPFALHGLCAWLTFDLAEKLTASRRAAWMAFLAFLAFPSVKGLVWVAAIGGPGRVACMLAGLCTYVRHLERPRWQSGILLVLFQLLAIGFHQSGFFLAPFCVLVAFGRGELRRALRDPWLLATLALSIGFALSMTYLFERAYPKSQPLAMAANLVRASLALAPETLRTAAIEGLRGRAGWAGVVAGGALVGAVLTGFALLLWRGSRAVRALALLLALDLLLPVLTVGFVVRYAYFASAIAACGMALVLDRKARGRRVRLALTTAVALLCFTWVHDSIVDVLEYRRAGEVQACVLREAERVRAEVGPSTPVALVDLPDAFGAEQDIPLFQWGTMSALTMAGAPGHWLLWRTGPEQRSSEATWMSTSDLEQHIAQDGYPILVFDPAAGVLVDAHRERR